MIQAESIAKVLCALSPRMKMSLGRRIANAYHGPNDRQPAMMGKLARDHFGLVISANDLANRMQRHRHEAITFGEGLLNDRQFP